MSERSVVVTEDGSPTLFVPGLGEYYHSKHGAIQESVHVFIQAGFDHVVSGGNKKIYILEIGFGTGLNAWLTLAEAQKKGVTVHYFAVEKYPLLSTEYQQLDYIKDDDFTKLHEAPWESWQEVNSRFYLYKSLQDFREITFPPGIRFNLVYFDAFSPTVQPALWDIPVFERICSATVNGGVLVTYCSKGAVRRNMQAAGWKVDKLPGPPGKREMVRAVKKT